MMWRSTSQPALFIFLLAGLLTAACETMVTGGDRPAIISEPNDASRKALQQVVADAMGVDAMLADDALTESSVLVITRTIPRDIVGSPAQGRIMEPPFQFHLVKSGEDCILIDQRNETRYRLDNTNCIEHEIR